jgi:hypothetical protein
MAGITHSLDAGAMAARPNKPNNFRRHCLLAKKVTDERREELCCINKDVTNQIICTP